MPSTPATRLRLVAFAAALLVAAAVIALAARTSLAQFSELADHIREEELGSFHIADVFQTNILAVNHTLVRFGTGEASVERQRFEQQSEALNRWLDVRKTALTTAREREVLQQIDRAYDDFLAAARHVLTTAEESADHDRLFAALEKSMQASQPLLDLGTALAAANQEANRVWRQDLRRSIARLQAIIFGSLAGLITIAAAGSVYVYRRMIAPLRTELEESRAVMARQEKLASLGVLAAGVAHEIRNPLTAIKLRLFTLRQELAGAGAEDTQVIAAEIERLEHIVKDFLQFARPTEPQLETLPARAIPVEVRDLLVGELAARGIALKLETVDEAEVRADSRQLKQVLLNLVRNAAESIAGSGAVTLRIRTGSGVLRERREPCVFIEVADTGAGIPAEVQQRLFDPFFSTKETGTGLGLAIAARIIEAHGGALKFETRVGEGTTFIIMLPRYQP